jgi:hypothetical protein
MCKRISWRQVLFIDNNEISKNNRPLFEDKGRRVAHKNEKSRHTTAVKSGEPVPASKPERRPVSTKLERLGSHGRAG